MKINIYHIIKDHFNTFRDDDGKRIFSDYAIFIFLPLIISFILLISGFLLSKDLVNTLITSMAIFVGLLLNFVVILFDIIKRKKLQAITKLVIKELIASISFCILLSFSSIFMMIGSLINNSYAKIIFSFCSITFLFMFAFTLLMVLKRMYIIFKNEMN